MGWSDIVALIAAVLGLGGVVYGAALANSWGKRQREEMLQSLEIAAALEVHKPDEAEKWRAWVVDRGDLVRNLSRRLLASSLRIAIVSALTGAVGAVVSTAFWSSIDEAHSTWIAGLYAVIAWIFAPIALVALAVAVCSLTAGAIIWTARDIHGEIPSLRRRAKARRRLRRLRRLGHTLPPPASPPPPSPTPGP